MRMIYCIKLRTEAEGLDFPPYPGPLGQKIYTQISKAAWQQWLSRQTMFINEYRLNLLDPQAREFLAKEMEKFLFEDKDELPTGYTPEKD